MPKVYDEKVTLLRCQFLATLFDYDVVIDGDAGLAHIWMDDVHIYSVTLA